MLRRTFAVFALTVLATQFLSTSADAQAVRGRFGPQVFAGPGGPVTLTPGYGYNPGNAYAPPAYAPAAAPAHRLPYSYYVLPASQPSRIYEGPGNFPFYGKPYGRPTDRWTWPYMSGDGNGPLARYFYPPLG